MRVAGLVGRFVVLRNMSFAVHGIAEVGFTGTAAAVLAGAEPVLGLLAGADRREMLTRLPALRAALLHPVRALRYE